MNPFEKGYVYVANVSMITEICCACGIAFGLPSDLQEKLRNKPSQSFYCPNGHGQHYTKSDEQTRREKAEKALQAKEQECKNLYDLKVALEHSLEKAGKQLKSAQAGVCPWCEKKFKNLALHLQNQHPKI